MQYRQTQVRRRWRDGSTLRDEREVAVWGQVSARTLHLVTVLNLVAAAVFLDIDYRRYWPCVAVFFAIGFGASAYSAWVASRKGIDLWAPRPVSRARLVVQCLVFGVLLYLAERFTAGGNEQHERWTAVAVEIAVPAVIYGICLLFMQAWQERRARSAHEATDDDALDERDPMP